MRSFIGLTVAACVVMLATAGVGKAQIVTITDTQYKVAANGTKTAEPKGTYSIPAPPAGTVVTWRVIYDYGTVANGAFTPTPNVHPGATAVTVIAKAGGNYNWSAPNVDTLTNPPVLGFYVRARLESQNGANWNTQATAYAPIP